MSKVTLFNAQNVEISPDAQTSGTGSLKIPDMAGGTKYLPLSPSAAHAAELAKLGVKGADIASASTTNLETATGELVDVTGTTAITAITLSEGHRRVVRFTGILTLTHGASLVLLGAANILTAAGDVAVFEGYAAGVVRMAAFAKASAAPWSAAVTLAQISDMSANARSFNAAANYSAMRLALGVSPSPVAALVAYVETTGDNASAVMGDPAKPYLTMQAAYDAGAKVFCLGGGTFAGITTTGPITINVLGRGRDGFGTSTKTTVTTIKSTDGGTVTVGDLGYFSVLFTTIESTFAAAGGIVSLRGCYTTTVRALAKGGAGSVTLTHSRAATIHCYGAEPGVAGGSVTLLFSQANTVNIYGAAGALSSDAGTPGGNGGNAGSLDAKNSLVTNVNAYGGTGGENDSGGGVGGNGGNGGSVTLLFTPFLTSVLTDGGSGGDGVSYGGADGSPGTGTDYVQTPVQDGVRSLGANQITQTTVGTTETQLSVTALAANTISAFDGAVEAVFAGTFAAGGGTTRRLRLLLDGTELFDSTAMTHTGAGSWELRLRFQGFVSNLQYTATLIANGVTVTVPVKVAQTASYGYSNPVDLELLGTSGSGGANGDITLLQSSVSYQPVLV